MKFSLYELKALLVCLSYEIEALEKQIEASEKDLEENYWEYYPLDKKMTKDLNDKKRYKTHLKNCYEKFGQLLRNEFASEV